MPGGGVALMNGDDVAEGVAATGQYTWGGVERGCKYDAAWIPGDGDVEVEAFGLATETGGLLEAEASSILPDSSLPVNAGECALRCGNG
jgi:hypothetical protein